MFLLLAIFYFLFVILFLIFFLWWLGFMGETLRYKGPDRVLYHGSDLGEQGPILQDIIQRYIGETKIIPLVEPGAGLAKVATYLEKKFIWSKIIAIELGPFIRWPGQLRAKFMHSKIEWWAEDMFKVDWPKPAVVYCYLFTELMDHLYIQGKLKNCLVISLTFPLTKYEAAEIIQLKGWQKRIYVYDFQDVKLRQKDESKKKKRQSPAG